MTPGTVPGRGHTGDCRHVTSEHGLGRCHPGDGGYVSPDTGSWGGVTFEILDGTPGSGFRRGGHPGKCTHNQS